jgi:anion-transporting  ArsA/GET3 family ATPase
VTASGLEQLLAAKEIVVFCGSGGVGKTSVAAAAALGAASRLGGKVLVLTIDPARRLATALGLEGLGNRANQVPPEVMKAAGVEPRGELWAAMLDTKQSWDDLVLRHAKDEETAYRILENRLYHNLTARFVQSHDYIAMERLYEIHAEGEYDLIIIDTPPTRNAIDFLEAPARMADFFSSRLLQDIAEFFLNFQSMYDGFVGRAKAVEQLLHARRTTFAVVTTLEAAPLHEAERFCDELLKRNFHLGSLVLNKTLPDYLLGPGGASSATAFIDDAGAIADAVVALRSPDLDDPARVARVLRTVGESFRNFAVVALREAEMRTELARVPDVVVRIPTFEVDIGDVEGLAAIGRYLFGEGAE